MRSALLGVCFALIVHRGGRATTDEDFRPTPIPLNEWAGEKAASAQGATTQAGSAPASPRYWEDALRHSVYLTFVRDRIDQLIAKGNALTPDSKLEAHAYNDIDDHSLWEKIKAAPFERIDGVEFPAKGDIALLAKGRLLEVNGELRFTEDELIKERCDEKCMQGVKALWSVRRVRQKDTEQHGKYHYELTFSVNSQTPKKIKKPFETPVRTFTVRDGTPVEQPTPLAPHAPRPQRAVWLHRNIVPVRSYTNHNQGQGLDRLFLSLFGSDEEDVPSRPIRPHPYASSLFGSQQVKAGHVGSPTEQYQQKKPHIQSHVYKYSRPPLGPPPTVSQAEHHYLESEKLKVPIQHPKVQYHFSDSDGKVKVPFAPPPVQLAPTQHQLDDKINSIYPMALPQAQAHAPVKLDHPTTDKNYTPIPFSTEVQRYLDEIAAKYPYNPPAPQYPYDATTVQHVEPQHSTANYQHNKELEPVTKNPPYVAQPDYRYQPTNVVKTTRPAVLPTPPIGSLGATKNPDSSETSTKEPEIVTVSAFKSHKKYPIHKLQQMKVSTLHFPDHVRPPVFNAPPGVFAPADKKPFKPMPPLKYHHQNYHSHSKHVKTRPIDFRPSPQVVDIQLFSEPDPLADAFRPMPVFTKNITDSNELSKEADNERYKSDHHKNVHKLKPNLEPVKSQQTTTSIPDIITAQSLTPEDGDSLHWANSLLSALAKTYPLESGHNVTEITPDEPTTTVTEPNTTVTLPTTTEAKNEEVTTTTRSPKRTRPPHKVVKTQKEKKHKRVTTTTTTSTTSTTTTERPRHKRPPVSDLTPQASSAATGTQKPSWQPKQKEQNDTTTTTQDTLNEDVVTPRSTTTTWPSTTTKLTTTSKPTRTTTLPEIDDQTTPKNINRFRQSTLFYKGTSVKHDKWSVPVTENNKTKPIHIKPNQQYQRRKGSNFHGYVSSTPKNVDEQHHKAEHKDLAYKTIETTTEIILNVIPVTTGPIQLVDNIEHVEEVMESSSENDDEEEDSNEQKGTGKDVVFYNERDLPQYSDEESKSKEVEEHNINKDTTPATVKKSKCKKKKNQNLTTTEETLINESFEVVGVDKVTTEKATFTTEADMLTQIFGGYQVEGLPSTNKTIDAEAAGSERKEQVAELKDDLEDFLDSLEENKSDNTYEYEDEEEDDDDDEFSLQDSKVNEKRRQRQTHPDISYDEYRERPYSLLELMAME